jgi:hypothetical protein
MGGLLRAAFLAASYLELLVGVVCMRHRCRSTCESPPPPMAKKKEVLDVDDSSPFERTRLESKDYSHDPHMMRLSY